MRRLMVSKEIYFFQWIKPFFFANLLRNSFQQKDKVMKKTWLAIFALFVGLTTAMAQQELAGSDKKDPVQRAERFTKKMTKELNLDAAQQERMKVVNLDRFKQLSEVKNTFANDKKMLQSKVKEINDNYFTTVKGILTPEQFTKFQEMKEEMKEKAMARRQAKKG
jgi:hypothetical protein